MNQEEFDEIACQFVRDAFTDTGAYSSLYRKIPDWALRRNSFGRVGVILVPTLHRKVWSMYDIIINESVTSGRNKTCHSLPWRIPCTKFDIDCGKIRTYFDEDWVMSDSPKAMALLELMRI